VKGLGQPADRGPDGRVLRRIARLGMSRGAHAYVRRGAVIAATLLAGVMWSLAVHATAARADFSESFCDGAPAPPWTTGGFAGGAVFPVLVDSCTNPGGSFGWGLGTPSVPQGTWSVGLTAAPGEVFTHAILHYTTQPVTQGQAFVLFGYGGGTVDAQAQVGSPSEADVDVDLPDTASFWGRYDCDTASCSTATQGILGIGAITMTVHDTGVPAVAAAGGSLAADGTVKGTQTLLFHATDTGSGVQMVTLSLGANVLATVDSTCQAASLAPCPADTAGTLSADTSLLPDGTYPVILTAYDVSGDPTPIQVSTVTVANHTGTVSVPIVRRGKGHQRRALKVKARFKWDWRGATTRLEFARFGRVPRGGSIRVACAGARCPFDALIATPTKVRRLERKLRHRVFRPGQIIRVTIRAPHRAAERGTLVIQAGALPRLLKR
jgi:hypothetical protein